MVEQAAFLALNHLLRDASWARDRLARHAGKAARIVAPPLRMDFVINADGTLSEAAVAETDVAITLPAHAPLLVLGRGRDALMREAHVTGSVELADSLGFVLRNLRWDVEEDLSRLVGDIGAHRIVGTARRLVAWQSHLAQSMLGNLAEYFRDERPTIAARGPVGEFNDTVDRLRDDLARLEARLSRLERGSGRR
jgi:ubiquinone biosynthesis protein UbiJ